MIQPFIEKGDVKIIYDQFVDIWHKDEGYKHMKKCLDKCGGEVDVVLCANDALAEGAIEALEEVGLVNQVLVCGQDAELEACQRIIAGKQIMRTIMMLYIAGVSGILALWY